MIAQAAGIMVVPVDRNVQMPKPTDTLDTQGWLRPRLWGGCPVAPVTNTGPGSWTAIGKQGPPQPMTAHGEPA